MAPASVMGSVAAVLLFVTTTPPVAADRSTIATSPPRTTAATAFVSTTAAATTTATTTTTTTTASTTATTTTAATTTTQAATTAAVTTATTAATTTAATTSPTTATAATSVSTSTAAEATSAAPLSFARGCSVSAVALLLPHRLPLLLGPVVSGRVELAGLSGLVYPADGSIVRGSRVNLDSHGCGKAGPAGGHAQVASVSLFAGAITAARLSLGLGTSPGAAVSALTVAGKRVAVAAGVRVRLGRWGYLVIGPRDAVRASGGGFALGALAVHLLQSHDGLPAGSIVLVAVAGLPAGQPAGHVRKRAARRHRRVASHQPLTVTPPLGLHRYIFPVVGPSDYSDTYGAFRSDVPGKWHHGDDIFAPLGAPVVAVASGTINRVGWEKLGGWRLWVRDSVGDEFYYAHLSGYAPSDLRSNHVQAGEVIGFLGNTGDAFTTAPHLHFEVHPRSLLHLAYDGAVDPTRYLNEWTRLEHVRAPVPAHPPLPSEPVLRQEARYVFRELLAARHLIKRAPRLSERPQIKIPAGANGIAIAAAPVHASAAPPPARAGRSRGGAPATLELLAAVTIAAALLVVLFRRREGGREQKQASEPSIDDG